jgi:predicted porin
VLSQEVVNVPSPAPGIYPGLVATSIAVRAVPVDSDAGVDFLRLNLRVAYQFASRASLYVAAGWQEQSFTGGSSLGTANRVDVTVGLNYSFDPVNF